MYRWGLCISDLGSVWVSWTHTEPGFAHSEPTGGDQLSRLWFTLFADFCTHGESENGSFVDTKAPQGTSHSCCCNGLCVAASGLGCKKMRSTGVFHWHGPEDGCIRKRCITCTILSDPSKHFLQVQDVLDVILIKAWEATVPGWPSRCNMGTPKLQGSCSPNNWGWSYGMKELGTKG